MSSLNIFAERLKELRLKNNLKQDDVGKIIGVTKTQISDMENGRRTTTIENLIILADYFNVSADYLIGRSQDPTFRK